MLKVDLNCDMGEGIPNDEAIMPFISSANIACGGHAGDQDSMRKTVELCLKYGVSIGAHPSFPDKENFGRANWLDITRPRINLDDLEDSLNEQTHLMIEICREFGTQLSHIKPHGALYNHMAVDVVSANRFCELIKNIGFELFFYGLSGSEMQKASEHHTIKFISEVFADRTYQSNGTLTPRSLANAMIEDESQSLSQVLRMIKQGSVISITGEIVPLKADSICIHGDGPKAFDFAKLIRKNLEMEGISIQAPELK